MTIETTMINAIKDFTMGFETYNYTKRDYQEEDILDYPRQIIIEAMLDKFYYLKHGNLKSGKSGSDVYASRKREESKLAIKQAKGGEIDINTARQAKVNALAATAKDEVFSNMMEQLQQLYVDTYGEEYIPYGAPASGNLPTHKIEVTKDMEDELKDIENMSIPKRVA
jgi:hypothetical protein